ncbi:MULTISPECIES: hypothetical protein [unclassified Nostoc]|uniref:hypothetical protein n=1 Tax=unclassified Nostoc TaxID=2593658 RepID=UPI002AD1F956|nr:hypothetical protein [Nostoc sp. DedQUE03]MDZ7971047.1 hypothetical protein [Nostoc sp. DedQUE03]MDZ8046522.1 hypothetical protein [Nostoc sp. DedQUE02]
MTDLSDILALLTNKLEKIGINAMPVAGYAYALIHLCLSSLIRVRAIAYIYSR